MQLALDFSRPAAAPADAGPASGFVESAPLEPSAGRGRPPRGRSRLLRRIQRALATPTELVVTDNRRTMISTRRRGEHLEVRLHHMFLDAPDEIIEELLSYLAEGDARASRRIESYIEENRHRIKRRGRRVLLRTRGAHHDLRALLDAVVEEHFSEDVVGEVAGPDMTSVEITWGRLPPRRRRRRRSIRLGTYTHDAQLIRIHPALDQASVPSFFVAFVIFHELLHHVVPARPIGSRLDHHPPAFKRRERAHPDYQRALRWETQNLDALLRFTGA